MSEDLQNLLEKINRDGIEKARAESERIIAEAEVTAKNLIETAKADAAKAKAEAEKAAAEYTARAEETLKQSARDTVLKIEAAVTKQLENLLVRNIDRVLAEESAVSALVAEVVKSISVKGELVCGEKLAKTLAAQLAASGEFSVVTDETLGSGFSVKLDGGRVEHSFTGATISSELAKRLRPDLAKLLA